MSSSSSSPAISRVGIVAKSHLRAAVPHLVDITMWLRARSIEAVFESATAALLPSADGHRVAGKLALVEMVDMVVVLGGDGTLLSMADCIAAAGKSIPILGVNFGSLGFLTEITLEELRHVLGDVLAGRHTTEERRLLHALVRREGETLAESHVLNDVVVTKAAVSRIIELDVSIDGRFVTAFRADGLIVSSTTGSTAYNLAAGGPILYPDLPAIVLTPICPHTLTHRPIVVNDSAVIEVRLRDSRAVEVHLTFDGQRGIALGERDSVTITRSPRTVRLVKAPSRDFFEVLRTKLKWGEQTVTRK